MTKIRYRKKIRKVLATVMSVSMIMGSVSFTAYADTASVATDSNAAQVEVSGEGTLADPQITTSTTTEVDPETGETTIVVNVNNQANGTNEDGAAVTTESIGVEIKVTDENGNLLSEFVTESGKEKTVETETESTILSEEKNTLLDEMIDNETGDQTIVTDPTTSDPEHTEWQESNTETGGEWVKDNEKSSDGDPTIVDSEAETSETTEIEFSDPLDTGDVTINLTPGTNNEEKIYISMDDLVNGNIEIPENKSYTDNDGNQVEVVVTEQKNENGDVIGYSVVTTTTNVKADTTSGETYEGETTETGSEVTAPSGYTEGVSEPVPLYDEAGNEIGYVVTETKAITDGSGNVIGYEIIKTTTKTQVETSAPTMMEGERSSTENTDQNFTLPTKPEESVITDETTGETTTITVEEVTDGAGNVIGYKSVTVKTDADGKELSKTSETLYGSSTTVKTTTTTDVENKNQVTTTTTETTIVETTKVEAELEKREVEEITEKTTVTETTVLTEEDVYQLVETEDGTYFLYKGEMWKVTGIGNHGSVDMDSLDVNMGLKPSNTGDVDENTDLLKKDKFYTSKDKQYGFEYQYLDYGLASAIKVNNGSGDSQVTQFVLVDSQGNKHYVLCADYSTSAVQGTSYNMVNVDEAEYFKNDGDNFNEAPYIRAIASNGYWGTDSGIGSLDRVKQVLRDAVEKNLITLSEAEINNITPGEALAATQAALWYYGDSKGTTEMPKNNVTGEVYNDWGYTRYADSNEKATVNALYKALINLDPAVVGDNTTELITKDNFATSASIVIKDNVENEDGTTKTDSKGNELYNADLSFTVEMTPSAIKGDMIVTVKDQYGNEIATKRIAGEDKENAATDSQGNAVYTFENLQLAEGVKLTLNLHGTQTLDQGVYLYTAQVYSNSQTFIGVAEGTRNVDLSVDMKFEVEKAEASVKKTSSSETTYEKDVTVETKTDVRNEERVKTTETNQSITDVDVTTVTRVYADVTVTETTETTTQTKKEWSSESKNEYTYEQDPVDPGNGGEDPVDPGNGGKDPVDPGNGGKDPVDPGNNDSDDDDHDEPANENNSAPGTVADDSVLITDEEVPLGNMTLQVLPKTGDRSVMWMLLSFLSSFGLAGMSLVEKKRKEEE